MKFKSPQISIKRNSNKQVLVQYIIYSFQVLINMVYRNTKMNKCILLLVLLISNIFFSQNQQFIYEYKYISDSTQKQNIENEIMILSIGKEKSEYFSQSAYAVDSVLSENFKRGINSMPPNKIMTYTRVIKRNDSPNNLEFFENIASRRYNINEEIQIHWELSHETIQILNFKAQKATAKYGGRKWTAWFCQEIPIPNGPYKFGGLPGLIVKIEDDTKSYIWEIKGIKHEKRNFVYPIRSRDTDAIKITYPQYIKAFRNYRSDPSSNIGEIPDHYSGGKFINGAERKRELIKEYKEDFLKDNNIIEIEMLKRH
ncbi:GLPGLI family protein [Elizabethkingia anophelis]|nr:GLPGLI family protein [Elizabethkingia anophelis]MCT3695301.1 GLPGLI family protein [Elizabethkingia anophelis]MCT3859258.1 GLPGLI family protein [Elizabethkingia anophelis]MCT3912571.1 GLPGLI family protein [Elizabethkingia anophelis]MCT4215780.1 GLPGLI family protein [Elizabethkingia anophelis]